MQVIKNGKRISIKDIKNEYSVASPDLVITQYDSGLEIHFMDDIEVTEVQCAVQGQSAIRKLPSAEERNVFKIPNSLTELGRQLLVYVMFIGEDFSLTKKVVIIKVKEREIAEDVVKPEDEPEFREEIQKVLNDTKAIAEDVKKRADDGDFNGEPGPSGEPGYTPVKGKDYFTDEEIEEIEKAAAKNVDLKDYVKNTDYATHERYGVVKFLEQFGVYVNILGNPFIIKATDEEVEKLVDIYKPIVPANLKKAVETIGGVINELATEDKSSYVGAINELMSAKADKENWQLLGSQDFASGEQLNLTVDFEGKKYKKLWIVIAYVGFSSTSQAITLIVGGEVRTFPYTNTIKCMYRFLLEDKIEANEVNRKSDILMERSLSGGNVYGYQQGMPLIEDLNSIQIYTSSTLTFTSDTTVYVYGLEAE